VSPVASQVLWYDLTYTRLSIEILPDDFEKAGHPRDAQHSAATSFLFIEGNLGVPKKALYRTYLDALAIFASSKNGAFEEGAHSARAIHNLVASSGVILLVNPGHLTALNARKRLVQRQTLDSTRELEFTAALLTSRNCANQSILWHHRQWLLRRIYGSFDNIIRSSEGENTRPSMECESGVEASEGILILPRETVERELSIASKACEIYPRNYFAWTHRHFCMQLVMDSLGSGVDSMNLEELAMVISKEVATMRRWIEQHISDSSAVHYLVTILDHFDATGLKDVLPLVSPNPENGLIPYVDSALTRVDDLSSTRHAISLVKSYPDHESLWQYFRAVFCRGNAQSSDIQTFTRSFIHPWAYQSQSTSGHDSKLVAIHAYRYLAWKAYQVGISL
jgi:protein prenyltransferase alpha subunit repeat containing protein 1